MSAPCNWELDMTCCPNWDTEFSAEQKAAATAFATEVLWALSGRQFGQCPKTVRPCGRQAAQTYRTYGVWTDGYDNGAIAPAWTPYVDMGGNWRNCGCGSLCTCQPSSQVWLPGPIASLSAITEVRVNNAVVPAGEYRLEVGQDGLYWLVGQLGRIWPDCQNFDEPNASPTDTFVVTYTPGKPVPVGGQIAGGLLACEFAKLCKGQQCALSAAATSITRDGVSYEILTASDLIKEGLTPMPSVNAWIISVNPKRKQERPRVWSPDMDYPRQTVA